jgi:hypothetical protein
MAKRSISPICCNDELIVDISSILNSRVADMPGIYLGLPLHFKKLRKEDFQGLIDRIRSWIAAWKELYVHPGWKIDLGPIRSIVHRYFSHHVSGPASLGFQNHRQD